MYSNTPNSYLMLICCMCQVEIFKLCRNLGVNTREFLCLGKKWNKYSKSYGDICPFDGAQPDIPKMFKKLVEDAIEASHEFLERRGGTSNPLVELPPMSPHMCTVNFDTDIPVTILYQVQTNHFLQLHIFHNLGHAFKF